MAISPTSPAPCQGPKGFLHCLVHRPRTPTKPTPLWDEITAFCLPRLCSNLPSSGYLLTLAALTSATITAQRPTVALKSRDLCHSRALQLVPSSHPGLGHPQLCPCFLQPGLSAELRDLQASSCYRIPARLPERSRSQISMTLYTFRSPSPLIFPGSLNQ